MRSAVLDEGDKLSTPILLSERNCELFFWGLAPLVEMLTQLTETGNRISVKVIFAK